MHLRSTTCTQSKSALEHVFWWLCPLVFLFHKVVACCTPIVVHLDTMYPIHDQLWFTELLEARLRIKRYVV